MRRYWSLLVVCLISVVFGGDYERIDLEWDPGKDPDEIGERDMRFWEHRKVRIEPVVDGRPEKYRRLLGISYEENAADPGRFITDDNVAAFMSRAMWYLASYYEVDLVKSDPELIITPVLRKVWITEEATYQGSIVCEMMVRNNQGDLLWEGTVEGSGSYWGDTFDEEIFLECLGNTAIDFMAEFLGDRLIQARVAQGLEGRMGHAELPTSPATTSSSQIEEFDPDDTRARPSAVGPSKVEYYDDQSMPAISYDMQFAKPSKPMGISITAAALLTTGFVLLIESLDTEFSSPDDDYLLYPTYGLLTAGSVCGGIAIGKWVKYAQFRTRIEQGYSRSPTLRYTISLAIPF